MGEGRWTSQTPTTFFSHDAPACNGDSGPISIPSTRLTMLTAAPSLVPVCLREYLVLLPLDTLAQTSPCSGDSRVKGRKTVGLVAPV